MNKKQRKLEIRMERHKIHENAKRLTDEQLEWQIEFDNELHAYHGKDTWEDDEKPKVK